MLEVVPSPLDLPASDDAVPLIVVVRNTTPQTMRNPALTWLTTGGLRVQPPAPLKIPSFASNAETAWVLSVSRPAPQRVAPTMELRVDFKADKATPQVLVQPITLKAASPDSADALVDVQLSPTLNSLETEGEGHAYLVITNKSARALRVYEISAIPNDVVSSVLASPKALDTTVIPPQQKLLAVMNVRVQKKILCRGNISWCFVSKWAPTVRPVSPGGGS